MNPLARTQAENRENVRAGVTRVSVREIREVALRALRATGLSSGEAECLADLMTVAEIHEGVGLDALATETGRVPGGQVGLHLDRGDDYAVVYDPASRGSLQVFVPACETAAVVGPLVVPGIAETPVLDWAALEVAERAGGVLALVNTSPNGERTRTSVVTGQGGLLRFPADAGLPVAVPPIPGLAILPLPGEPGGSADEISTAAQRKHRYREAVTRGVYVDSPLWMLACSIARGFLVPENPENR